MKSESDEMQRGQKHTTSWDIRPYIHSGASQSECDAHEVDIWNCGQRWDQDDEGRVTAGNTIGEGIDNGERELVRFDNHYQ